VLAGFDRKIKVSRSFLEDLRSSDIQNNDYMDYADDILILQGTADEVVQFSSVKTFAENNVINFNPVEGADHRFIDLKKMNYANSEVIKFFGLK
jgi:alpha/beta superfamily hydrolase